MALMEVLEDSRTLRGRVDSLENFLEAVWDWAENNDWICEVGRNELLENAQEAEGVWGWAVYLRRPGMKLAPINRVKSEVGMNVDDYRHKVWLKIGREVAKVRRPRRRAHSR